MWFLLIAIGALALAARGRSEKPSAPGGKFTSQGDYDRAATKLMRRYGR